jgi:hypothetical protein
MMGIKCFTRRRTLFLIIISAIFTVIVLNRYLSKPNTTPLASNQIQSSEDQIFEIINFSETLNSTPIFITENKPSIEKHETQIHKDLKSFRQQLMYPYNLNDFTEITSAKPIHDQPLPFRLPFFGFSYHYVWVKFLFYFKFSIHIIISNV